MVRNENLQPDWLRIGTDITRTNRRFGRPCRLGATSTPARIGLVLTLKGRASPRRTCIGAVTSAVTGA
jgi:hypothetical protein